MGERTIRDYAESRNFHAQTVERWLRWAEADRELLKELVVGLKLSENHLRDVMDWLEEIALRDGAKIQEILARPAIDALYTDPRLGRSDKLKRIKEQIRRWRFPRLASIEDDLAARIKDLKLPVTIRLLVPAGLEGGRLTVEFGAASAAQMGELSGRLRDAAATEAMAEIFALLQGQSRDGEAVR